MLNCVEWIRYRLNNGRMPSNLNFHFLCFLNILDRMLVPFHFDTFQVYKTGNTHSLMNRVVLVHVRSLCTCFLCWHPHHRNIVQQHRQCNYRWYWMLLHLNIDLLGKIYTRNLSPCLWSRRNIGPLGKHRKWYRHFWCLLLWIHLRELKNDHSHKLCNPRLK